MKRYILPLALALALLLPCLLFSLREREPVETEPAAQTEEQVRPTVSNTVNQMIRVKEQDTVVEMELDSYVLGVVLGEMPADFELEALKAQAVATRTYTLRKVLKQSKHSDAHVCTDASCCQAFIREDDYLQSKGDAEDLEKVRRAVTETTGQVLTYQGELIEATYFSSSGGKTEDAVAVWGTSVPYLQSVSSPGEEPKNGEKQFQYSKQEFRAKLGLPESAVLTDDSMEMTYTEGGGVEQMTIGNQSFSGTELRTLLGLPSTVFSLSFVNGEILLTTKGNGHRVGMSQYGAEAMAVAGSQYDEILYHYYSGTKLETLTDVQMQAIFDKAGNL